MKDENGRLTRWSLSLQPYNFRVIHRAGTTNANVDGLSRQGWEAVLHAQKKEKGVLGGPSTTDMESPKTTVLFPSRLQTYLHLNCWTMILT